MLQLQVEYTLFIYFLSTDFTNTFCWVPNYLGSRNNAGLEFFPHIINRGELE